MDDETYKPDFTGASLVLSRRGVPLIMMRSLALAACLLGSASAFAPHSALAPRRSGACAVGMSCAAAPALPPMDLGARAVLGAVADLLDGVAERLGEFEMPNVLMAIPGRKGPSNKARAGTSGFRARKLTKNGQKILRNRRKKGRKHIIPSPGRHPIHGL